MQEKRTVGELDATLPFSTSPPWTLTSMLRSHFRFHFARMNQASETLPQVLAPPQGRRQGLLAGQCGYKVPALFVPCLHPETKFTKCSGVVGVTLSCPPKSRACCNGTGDKMGNAEAECFLTGLLSKEA